MEYLTWTLRVQLLFFSVALFTPNTAEPAPVRRESFLITAFLQKFITPFIRTTNFTITPASIIKHEKEPKILKLIRNKVKELKPLLEDTNENEHDETDDNLTLRGADETTVIEFLPKATKISKDGEEKPNTKAKFRPDPLKSVMNKYKLLREQIKIALDKENISKDTKALILNTLDEMLALLIESQCIWNPSSYSIDQRLLKAHNDTHETIIKLHGMTKKQWKQLRHQYLGYLNQKRDKENAFMNEFHHFFSSVINDTYNLTDRYKIKCQLVEMQKDEQDKPNLREYQSLSDNKNACKKFKVCSEELKDFLNEFYIYVNDTAVSTFKNYAEMYARDVNVDFGLDKNVVINVLNSLASNAENKVTKIYKKAIKKLTLDPNKLRHSNIKLITKFIKNVVYYVKTAIKENLVQELGAMKTKLFMTVKEDLLVNFEIDMDNLERHYVDTLCSMFLSCNGRFSTRKLNGPWVFRPKANREVFVKVQLSLDDELKDAVGESGLLQIFEVPEHMKYKISRKNLSPVNVTRTTIHNIVSTTPTHREHSYT